MSKPADRIKFDVPQKSAAERKKMKKLGKGLGALMSETKREEPLVASPAQNSATGFSDQTTENASEFAKPGLASIPIAMIDPLPGQPRTHFDEDALSELAASISARGVIQPIIVRAYKKGRYQLVAGERRWRAAQKARLHEIPAIIRDLSSREVMALALIENIQREDLNPVEEARAYQKLSESEGLKQAEIARMVDKSRSHVVNLQRLLQLPSDVLDLVESQALSMGHARALIGHDNASVLAKRAVKETLSVREVERLVRESDSTRVAEQGRKPAAGAQDLMQDADIVAVQKHLEEFLGLNVRIKTDADPTSGAVTIKYRTLDQLDLICQRLTGGEI